tara:strand:- start:1804 stop:2784 length:981 start_codon:yes stop_codon:yes gene_type:complete
LVERRLRAKSLEKDLTELNVQITQMFLQRRKLEEDIYAAKWDRSLAQTKHRKEFVRKCPVEECRGFLSTQWKCGLCENKICPDCNEVKVEGHECDPGNVETVKLLKKDTKPCPKCGTMIFKISGCSQMWCPDCHTVFCWNTMRIESGVIHNPHYYDFQRQHGTRGRNHGDIPCGGFPDLQEIRVVAKSTKWGINIYNIHRRICHLQDVELRFNYHEHPNPEDATELRIQYMMNMITENYMKQALQKREKAAAKLRDIRGIIQMVVDTGSDLLRQIVLDPNNYEEHSNVFENLKEYYNDAIGKISHRYTCVVPFLNLSWTIDRRKAV